MLGTYQAYATGGLFAALPEHLRTALIAISKTSRYEDCEQVHGRGDRERALSVIESGTIRFSNVGRDGKRVSIATLGAGESFGEFTLFADTPRLFDMHATGASAIKVINRRPFENLLATEPELSRFIIEMLARRLLLSLEMLDDERRLPLVTRLAKILLRRPRTTANELEIVVTQKELADELSVSRVALATALNKLRQSGLLETSYGRMTIIDWQTLQSWVEQNSELAILLPFSHRA